MSILIRMDFLNSLFGSVPAFLLSLWMFGQFLLGNTAARPVVPQQPIPAQTATTTKAAANSTATTTKKIIPPKAGSVTTAKLPAKKAAAPKPQATTTTAVPVSVVPDNAGVSASPTLVESVNAMARVSLVNILCTTVTGGPYAPISGSGILLDSRGIILTNAHVAQYFLLKDYPFKSNISCVIRTGSPAQPLYTAEVMYLPKEWVDANASQLTAQRPVGTGENDFAFLRITGGVSGSVSVPASFPILPFSGLSPEAGAPVLLAAYPAGLLSGETIQKNLYQSSAVSSVKEVYTFGSGTVDLISLNGTVVSQSGSSGGALLGLGSQKLLGLIATETTGTTTSDRLLNAISISYIDRALFQQGKGGIAGFLTGDAAAKALDYQTNLMPQEIQLLESTLKKSN